MKVKLLRGTLAACLLLFAAVVSTGEDEAAANRFEELAARYAHRMEGRSEANALRRELEEEAEERSPYERWRSLFVQGVSPRKGAANALALLSDLIEGGDPARWESVSGFFLPSFVSKPLAAADALYAALLHLLELDDPGADALAGMLLERFAESSRAKFLFLSTAPEEYPALVRRLTERGIVSSFGRWTEGEIEGRLPFASPVRERISRSRALLEDMVFLNSAGQPAPNGAYAWDRRRGRIYEVMDEEYRSLWIID